MSKPKELSDQNINGAIAWYEAHKEVISAALPISVPGVTYKAGCLEALSSHIQLWHKKELALNLAVCYVHRPISDFYTSIIRVDKN
jgi:hypothetical protein